MQIATHPFRAIHVVLKGVMLALALTGCAGGEAVTARSLAEARRRWDRAAIRDYNLEWTSSGLGHGHYEVTVRGGQVAAIESILAGGKRVAVHTAEPRFYGVDGLFTVIGDELALLDTSTPFGQPKGTKAVLRFEPDPKLGYPRSYRRDVLGTPLALAIDVVRFEPAPGTPAGVQPAAAP
jgi:hypothetical protein